MLMTAHRQYTQQYTRSGVGVRASRQRAAVELVVVRHAARWRWGVGVAVQLHNEHSLQASRYCNNRRGTFASKTQRRRFGRPISGVA
jgi:hypothetical protein